MKPPSLYWMSIGSKTSIDYSYYLSKPENGSLLLAHKVYLGVLAHKLFNVLGCISTQIV